MPRIGVTGGSGFLGWHLRCALHADDREIVDPAPREVFSNGRQLERFVATCDSIVHLAGVNRGDDVRLEHTNVDLTKQLVAALAASRVRPQVILASSIHQSSDTAYGRSKRVSAELLANWAAASGGTFTNLILPHVFGECGRPFYNSVVATFCHQLACGEAPRVLEDRELELVHAQRVAGVICDLIRHPTPGEHRVTGIPLSVGALLARLQEMAGRYANHVIPKLGTALDLELFNTYRSFLFPGRYPMTPVQRTDDRGRLFEAVNSEREGGCFISTTPPGVTRGNHYHMAKIERFLVISGNALIRVRKLFSTEITEYRVCGDLPQYVDMPTLHTHNITNMGHERLITLFWASEIFDPSKPDTYPEPV
ncbi:MAG: SDR family oxidoreductase [Betaproteobacteria bacterium]|nr:SDR family oxidoreductase [Betaproteobacteria bacterium]